ncbi:unannotated protein [freshwater metagenome]|uniref:Unannotated protein n=1 Tax=freshwater metagenome TaxID=449393 RepID=A0A6J6N2Q0_9ZZZZ|nr:nucleoside phosphorylase [Actinomycetota bacterium]
MRLHREISSDLPLLVVALEEEATHLHVTELPVLVTGAGKVNAAVAVATILGKISPARVINLGTAGALRDGVSGTQVISRVTQHDLDDAELFELTGLHFGAPIEFGGTGPTLTTGDDFVSNDTTRNRLAKQADLVDMEGYAIAHAAAVAGIPLTIVKQVSDQAGSAAGKSWSESVDECAEQLAAWVRANVLR